MKVIATNSQKRVRKPFSIQLKGFLFELLSKKVVQRVNLLLLLEGMKKGECENDFKFRKRYIITSYVRYH